MPVLVVAGESAEAGASALGKAVGLKELRLAAPELLVEFFGVDKDSCMSFLIISSDFECCVYAGGCERMTHS